MISRSEWGAKAGRTLPSYFDIDKLFAADYRLKNVGGAEASRRALIREVLNSLETIRQEHAIDYVAFIDEGEMGPVGALWLATSVAFELNVRLLLLRPWKELVHARIKGDRPEPGEKVVIVTDVITTGSTIFDAVETLNLFGAKCEFVYTVVLRDDDNEIIANREKLLSKMKLVHWRKASELESMVPYLEPVGAAL